MFLYVIFTLVAYDFLKKVHTLLVYEEVTWFTMDLGFAYLLDSIKFILIKRKVNNMVGEALLFR